MCMKRVGGWVSIPGCGFDGLYGYKVVKYRKKDGTLRSSIYGHTWQVGANYATGREKDSFFHMYTSPLDALDATVPYRRQRDYAIIMLKPEEKIVRGLDNSYIVHVMGAKRVRFQGCVLLPNKCHHRKFDVYSYRDGKLVLKKKGVWSDNLSLFYNMG